MKRWLNVILALALIVPPLSAQAETPVRESRVIFAQYFPWASKDGTDFMLERVSQAGFNVIVPCVWLGKGTSWPSSLAPRDPKWEKISLAPREPRRENDRFDPLNYQRKNLERKIDTTDFDSLKYLVEKAHSMGIEVHPWFAVVARNKNFNVFPEFMAPGTPEKAFDLHNPAFRKFIVDVMLEVVKRYDVDGIVLDYIRSRGVCKTASCVADYRSRYGRDLLADAKLNWWNKDFKPRLIEWNREAVSDIVRQVSESARTLKPDILVSVATKIPAWDWQGAAGDYWVRQGWVDLVIHFDYRWDLDEADFKEAQRRVGDPSKIALMVGNIDNPNKSGIVPRDPQRVVEHIEQARRLAPESHVSALWLYDYMSAEQVSALRNGPYRKPAVVKWPRPVADRSE